MPEKHRYELIIIGAGVAGVYVAYAAAKKNINTLIIERSNVPEGATPKSGGVVTRMMDNPLDAEMAAESIRIIRESLQNNEDIINNGYISIEDYNDAIRDREKFKKLIPDIRLIDKDEITSKWSYIKTYDDEVGLYSPSDLTLNPFKMLAYMWDILEDMGVDLLLGKNMTRLLYRDNQVYGVELEDSCILYSDKTVLAAGAWNREILNSLGTKLDVWLIGVPIFRFRVDEEEMIGVWDENIYSYWRPEAKYWIGGVYDSFPIEKADDGFKNPSEASVMKILEGFKYRFRFNQWKLVDSWSGPISISHDYRPIYEEIESWKNLFVIDGLGGRGLMRGPAIGKRLIANMFK